MNINELYPGYRSINVAKDKLRELCDRERISWPETFRHNEYILLTDKEHSEPSLARYDGKRGELVMVYDLVSAVSGIRPLNIHQRIAMDLLLNDDIKLVTLVGKAGTGKTLLALAGGMKKVFDDNSFSRMLVSRPVVPFGKDIGYLPGTKDEKLSPWMQPLFDNLEYILSVHKRPNVKGVESIINSNLIELEALTYIRGRSLPNQYIIIDEAQNLSPHEVKTIVSRSGEGTKMVLTGDPYQIDSPYLDSNSNGLTYLVEAFKGQELFGHVTLDKSERSPLAELAAELL